ncbi:hypothetical protein INR49_023610 [Caranx melampygus]|nr:hypothetical protein INR49_023610 [Caranx melampygus]
MTTMCHCTVVHMHEYIHFMHAPTAGLSQPAAHVSNSGSRTQQREGMKLMWNLRSHRVGVLWKIFSLSVFLSSPGGHRGRWDRPAQVLLWVDPLDDTPRVSLAEFGLLLYDVVVAGMKGGGAVSECLTPKHYSPGCWVSSEGDALSIDIGTEVKYQNKMLEDMDTDFDSTGGLLGATIGRVKQLSRGSQTKLLCYMLLFCFFVCSSSTGSSS